MCGIAGFITVSKNIEQKKKSIDIMMSRIAHRGPDGEGVWLSESSPVVLGHRRLAIQDLSDAGHQPMRSADGRYVIVFNGEIYNFQELQAELMQVGYLFEGHSDTEVLLALIQHRGLEVALQKCNGMFALALLDVNEQTLCLARDRIGEKPLYYGWVDGVFSFASQLNSVVSFSENKNLNIDQASLASYLRYGHVPAPYSIYQKIYKLSAGTILTIDLAHDSAAGALNHISPSDDRRIKSFWSLYDSVCKAKEAVFQTEEEAHEALKETLERSVKRQIISDAPLGAFLSGGYDSTLVTALAAKVSPTKLSTFTIGFDEKQFDESEFAASVAKHIGTDHHEIILSSHDAMNVVPSIPQYYDEPFANASQIPTFLVSKYASESVKVCLSGDGGDELFAGYNRYTMPEKLASRTQKFPRVVQKIAAYLINALPSHTINKIYGVLGRYRGAMEQQANVDLKLKKVARFLENPNIQAYYQYLLSICPNPTALLLSNIERHYVEVLRIPASIQNNFIERAQYQDQLFYLPDDCLTKVDRASMAMGLEVRAPLLDYELIELSWRFSVSQKVNEGKAKWPLRKVLYEHVPRELMDRPKMGFTVPINDWLKGGLRDWAEALLCRKNLGRSGCFDVDAVTKLWGQNLRGETNDANSLWAVLMFLAWSNRDG